MYPPLNALRAFEVVARSGSIRAASEILNVTQSSISRHVSILEGHLQRKLFYREGRGLRLTEAGEDYLLQIADAFETISNATAAIKNRSKRAQLTLSAPLSLTANWLIPRLKGFLAENTDIDIRLVEGLTFDPSKKDIDCAIEYRFQPAPELASTLLLRDEIVPLISPNHFNVLALSTLDCVKGITLIETSRRLVSWHNLLEGKHWLCQQPFFTVNHTVHALEAAQRGIGIALANRHNAHHLIDTKKLVIPFLIAPSSLPRTPRYYISVPPHRGQNKQVLKLQSWLLKESKDRPSPNN
ncbi:LysR family transcriptional regulator [Kordiimonas pumila]|uniref:LysR family transcriptional regulator n=1 Tax=Kordiimonas pumila TaxID=2161677 RepID=A0ABV7D4L1_9PROT|nr:LysR family transcriptional regulator [Kordiimonas pumila]